jgi:hypothetical protein
MLRGVRMVMDHLNDAQPSFGAASLALRVAPAAEVARIVEVTDKRSKRSNEFQAGIQT